MIFQKYYFFVLFFIFFILHLASKLIVDEQAKDKLEKSMVADNESGKSIASEVRTSSGMFLRKAQVSKPSYLAWLDLPIRQK